MQEFITRQLFLTVLSLSLSGAIIGMMIAAIHPFTGKYCSKKWNYYIWLLVVVRLLIPFHFEADFPRPLHFHTAFGQEDNTASPENTIQNDGGVWGNGGTAQFDDIQLPGPVGTGHPGRTADTSDKAIDVTLIAANVWTAAAYIWLLGAILAFLIKLLNYRHFQNRIKKSCIRVTDDGIITMENALCARLHVRKTPAIYESAAVSIPMTIGLWNPMIVLPKIISDRNGSAFPGMKQDLANLRLVLHHELIHVARRDLLYKWIYQILLCIHWFNPVLHRIGRRINSDCELSCDEAILAQLTETGKQLYGNVLLDAAEQNIACGQNAFITTLLENKKELKRRLDNILHYKKASRLRPVFSVCVFVMILNLSACGTVWISSGDISASEPVYDSSAGIDSDDMAADRESFRDENSGGSGLFWRILSSFTSADSFVDNFAGPDRSSDAWKAYDDEKLLAGEDIQENWAAYNYRGGGQKLRASGFVLYGTDSFVIAYADQDTDVDIKSFFDIREGKFKIIYVAPDNSIVTLNDTGAETTQTVTLQKGRNVLKMAGQGAKLADLAIDYSGLGKSGIKKVYSSETEEYGAQVVNGVISGETVRKDKVIDALAYIDDKDASEVFNVLLSAGTTFTTEELYEFLIYSDETLSSQYLLDAVNAGNIEPLSADAISELMPYLTENCQTELLKSLPLEEFYDIFAENACYLNNSQIDECLMDYMDRGGVVTYSMYDEISGYVSKSILQKLDRQLPALHELP